MRIPIAGVSALAAMWALGGAAGAQTIDGAFERSVAIVGADVLMLDVRTSSGGIEVQAGEPGEARIAGRIRGYADRWTPDGRAEVEARVRRIEAEPPIEFDGEELRVGYGLDWARQVAIEYEIVVPVNTRGRLSTGSGELAVQGIRGPVEATNGAGATRVADIEGDVTVEAGSGRLELRGIAGAVDARTGSGPVVISDAGGSVRAYTGSGPIESTGAPHDAWELRAATGAIHLDLPDAEAFVLDARTGSGSVRVDHEMAVDESGRGRLAGVVGAGGPRLVLRTGSGAITVE